jgi:hypothetical protein
VIVEGVEGRGLVVERAVRIAVWGAVDGRAAELVEDLLDRLKLKPDAL